VVTAASTGIPVKAFAQADTPGYVTVASTDIAGPADLGGKRVGIHAQVSVTTLLTDVMMKNYPSVKPQILIVPGSANRISALVAGQLDASVVQLSDVPTLEKQAPGKFHVIYDFPKTNSDLVTDVYYASAKTLESDRPEPGLFLAAVLDSVREIYGSSPDDVGKLIQKYVPATNAAALPDLAKLYQDSKMWPADGGMDPAALTSTIDVLHSSGMVKSAVPVDTIVNDTVLRATR
jgi:ABC-type nitrate/sulfonate/bicarbonate transport system substrate-binding protein